MRILITGDRAWYDPETAESVFGRLIVRHGAGFRIVHGGASGIDRSFAEACGELGIEQEVHPARWEELDAPGALLKQDRNGRQYVANAGAIRNAEMVAAGAAMCIAFHRDLARSKGTRDCARRAIQAGIPTYLVEDERAEPVRVRAGDRRLG
ncbi:SLOG family protein [Paludisphaera soli]|uniref:SLOG family protein n=1 Tax=Paludisphaera soli TaxID=2712865 RepID=UPI0013EBE9A5|nr:SLOG family protein [Paludisphaera soli]